MTDFDFSQPNKERIKPPKNWRQLLDEADEYLTVKEIAKLFKVSTATVSRWRRIDSEINQACIAKYRNPNKSKTKLTVAGAPPRLTPEQIDNAVLDSYCVESECVARLRDAIRQLRKEKKEILSEVNRKLSRAQNLSSRNWSAAGGAPKNKRLPPPD